ILTVGGNMTAQPAPALLWSPTPERISRSQMRRYMDWLSRERCLTFSDYDSLWRWSITDLDAFWASLWDYFDIKAYKPYRAVLAKRTMPGAEWFPGAELNFVDQGLRHETDRRPAVLYASEQQGLQEMSWRSLREQVASVAALLRQRGIRRGDRVVAFAPNTPETLVAFLATVSIGAIWSVCSPDMGLNAVLDRFRQIEPKALFAVPSSHYGGKYHDKGEVVAALVDALPSVTDLILLPGTTAQPLPTRPHLSQWSEIIARPADLKVEPVPFDHPLWIVYSSGTTGLPKPIVHGHGGIILVIMAMMALHNDISSDDIYHWYSSTGWIMWNAQVAGLLVGATIAIYDGSPGWPDWNRLWAFAGETKATFFGAGAAFYANCQKAGVKPRQVADLSSLRSVGSTGSPLSEDSYAWIYGELGSDIWLTSISG